MKQIVFFLLISVFSYGQPVIDIRLVNSQIGYPTGSSGMENPSAESNDAGLNSIFQTYGVYRYQHKAAHPYPDYNLKMMEVLATGDLNQLVVALNAYSNVVEKAVISDYGIFKDAVQTKLVTDGIGIPTGSSNNIITTNDPGLNQIFSDYNVFHYTRSFPSSNTELLLRVYDVVCDCDNVQLKNALDNYTTVIESESTQYSAAAYLLNTSEFDKNTFSIYPNPFNSTLTIESSEQIIQFSLFDTTGKQLITTAKKGELDLLTSKLNSGIYLLQLNFEDGKSNIQKIIKN